MIDSFFGKHRFLSNFWPAEVKYKDNIFPTVEHAYQAAKCSEDTVRTKISQLSAMQAGKAKQMGRQYGNKTNWDETKLAIMEDLVRQKFSERFLKEALLATGTCELIEGNTWNDTFWGVNRKGEGENHLGRILMKVRGDLIALQA